MFYFPYFIVLVVDNVKNEWTKYMRHWAGSALVHVMACRLFGAKPISEPMLGYYNHRNEVRVGVGGGGGDSPCLSVCLSVR